MLLFKHGSIEQFTGQGVEKLNDIIRKIHNQKSSRQDACFAALSACERIQIHKGHINVKKNKYSQRKPSFLGISGTDCSETNWKGIF